MVRCEAMYGSEVRASLMNIKWSGGQMRGPAARRGD